MLCLFGQKKPRNCVFSPQTTREKTEVSRKCQGFHWSHFPLVNVLILYFFSLSSKNLRFLSNPFLFCPISVPCISPYCNLEKWDYEERSLAPWRANLVFFFPLFFSFPLLKVTFKKIWCLLTLPYAARHMLTGYTHKWATLLSLGHSLISKFWGCKFYWEKFYWRLTVSFHLYIKSNFHSASQPISSSSPQIKTHIKLFQGAESGRD